MNELLTGEQLKQALSSFPSYNQNIRKLSSAQRLDKLTDVLSMYYPFPFSSALYTKLYMAIQHAMKKKDSLLSVSQRYRNLGVPATHLISDTGILGGADCFTVLGRSGIGKSTAIARALNVMGADKMIEAENPDRKIAPVVTVQCPWDSSVKGLLVEILRKLDITLGTEYNSRYSYHRTTIDVLIGVVSTICINHIGLLIIDEIQNVITTKHGFDLIRAITQLLNSSGISVCMVGTPECSDFFEADPKLARRSLGIRFDDLEMNEDFVDFCRTLWTYQYTASCTNFSMDLIPYLYEKSGGVTANVVSLFYLAQQTAISSGTDKLSIDLMNYVSQIQMSFIYDETNLPAERTRTKELPIKSKPEKESSDLMNKTLDGQNGKQQDVVPQAEKADKQKCPKPELDLEAYQNMIQAELRL